MSGAAKKRKAKAYPPAPKSAPVKRMKFSDMDEPELPTLGYKQYAIAGPAGWTTLQKETFFAPIRPAMARVTLSYSHGGKSATKEFDLNYREWSKKKPSQVKLNPFYKMDGVGHIYYAKDSAKYKAAKKKKTALDDVPTKEQPAYAQDLLRVMKGTAHSKGLTSAHVDNALLGGSLIMTSERGRHLLNPYNAHIELYKIKHRKQIDKASRSKLSSTFHDTTGTFVAARAGGADTSRKLVDGTYLDSLMDDKAMKDIFKNYASKKPKYAKASFEEWREMKVKKMMALYPVKK